MANDLDALWNAIETLQRDVSTLKAERDGTPRSRARGILNYARMSFETRDTAHAWLLSPCNHLGGKTPLDAALESRESYVSACDVLARKLLDHMESEQELDILLACKHACPPRTPDERYQQP